MKIKLTILACICLLLNSCNTPTTRIKSRNCEKIVTNITVRTEILCEYKLYCEDNIYVIDVDTCGKYHIGDKFK